MALTNCPECQKSVSDMAPECPHCGYPINSVPTQSYEQISDVKESSIPKDKLPILIVASAIILIVIIAVVISFSGKSEKDSSYSYGYDYDYYDSYDYSNYEVASLVLEIENVEVDLWDGSYATVTGRIRNTGVNTYTFVKVKGVFTDWSGDALDTDWTYVVGSEGLAPGEAVSFEMSVKNEDRDIRDCTVSLYDYSVN